MQEQNIYEQAKQKAHEEKEQQAQKRPEDEQLQQKQDKTSLNAVSEPKNDTKQTSKIYKQR